MSNTKKNAKSSTKKKLNSIILLLALAAIILIISTYAWFSTQRNVTITNLGGTVQVAEGMEISLDGKSWKQSLDLSQVTWTDTTGETEFPVYENNTNNIPSELQPVSTVGAVPTSGDLLFYKGQYASGSGVLTDVVACTPAITDESTKVGAILNDDEDDFRPVDDEYYPAYFAFDVFIKNTIQARSAGTQNYGTEEAPAWESNLQLNYDSFAKILEKVTGEGNTISSIDWGNNVTDEQLAQYASTGFQNTIRIGFATYNKTANVVNSDAIAATVNPDGGNTIKQIAIWEPNSSNHVSEIVETLGTSVLWNEEGDGVLTKTDGVTKYNPWDMHTKLITFGITPSAAGNTVRGIYTYAGRTDAYMALQNSVKTTPFATTEEVEGVNVTTYNYNELNEGVTDLYDTTVAVNSANYSTTAVPFHIACNQVSRVRVYLWIEGQDVDCLNIASMGHGINVNIDLTTGVEPGTRGE